MDNRWSDRKDLDLGVDIYHQGNKRASCRSRDIGLDGQMMGTAKAQDIGLGGTYIGTCDTLNLGKNSVVELVFHISDGNQAVKYSLHARVVRVDHQGIGLKFHAFDTILFRSLQQLLCYKESKIFH